MSFYTANIAHFGQPRFSFTLFNATCARLQLYPLFPCLRVLCQVYGDVAAITLFVTLCDDIHAGCKGKKKPSSQVSCGDGMNVCHSVMRCCGENGISPGSRCRRQLRLVAWSVAPSCLSRCCWCLFLL